MVIVEQQVPKTFEELCDWAHVCQIEGDRISFNAILPDYFCTDVASFSNRENCLAEVNKNSFPVRENLMYVDGQPVTLAAMMTRLGVPEMTVPETIEEIPTATLEMVVRATETPMAMVTPKSSERPDTGGKGVVNWREVLINAGLLTGLASGWLGIGVLIKKIAERNSRKRAREEARKRNNL